MRSALFLIIFSYFIFSLLFFFHSRGILVNDEGYILHNAQRIVDGQIPYRDFHFVYTPGSILATASFFALFGTSVMTGKWLMILLSYVTCLIIFAISRIITKNNWHSLIPVFIYLFWGPAHTNFAWPVMFCISTGLVTCLLFLLFLKKQNPLFLFLAGVTTIMTMLFKQNFGVILLNAAVFFSLIKNTNLKQLSGFYLSGIGTALVLFAFALVATHSFIPFVLDMYHLTIERIVISQELTTPFIYADTPLKMIAKTGIYLFPLAISAYAMVIVKKQKELFFLCTFVILYYVVGIRPTTDYVHLTPLLSLTGIPLMLATHVTPKRINKIFLTLLALLLILVGLHTALFKGHYRWHAPLIDQKTFVPNERMQIATDINTAAYLNQINSLVQQNSNKGDYIFVDYYAPIIYFLADRKQPTSYDSLEANVSPEAYEQEVLTAVTQKNVTLFFSTTSQMQTDTVVNRYVKENYKQIVNEGTLSVWKRK